MDVLIHERDKKGSSSSKKEQGSLNLKEMPTTFGIFVQADYIFFIETQKLEYTFRILNSLFLIICYSYTCPM